jgi:hypothetical protein
MADLTKFDFNAHNFMNSEAVEAMNDAEVGQYILLLAKSWLLAKDASLPDDLESLARWAHTKRVSDKVLAKFPVVDTPWGQRRRNEVLYNEWIAATSRIQSAVDFGRRGSQIRWGADRDPNRGAIQNESGDQWGSDRVPQSPNPIQSKPSQTNPSQGNAAEVFEQAKRVFRRHAHKSWGQLGGKAGDWRELVNRNGMEIILRAVELWSEENADYARNTQWPLAVFMKQCPEYIDAAREEVQTAFSLAQAKEAEKQILERAEQERQAREAEYATKKAEEAEVEAAIAANPDSLFGA